ncbi:MAG: hypothetical protein ACI4VH_03070 [Clostridia bacterium]
MYKIYSRPRIKIPRVSINRGSKGSNPQNKKILEIIAILIIAISTVKFILDAVYPIFDTLCESKAKSIATMVSNEQATNVMREHSYDELFTVEKDSNNNITMIKSNVLAINEIISDVALKIQEDIDNRGKENIEIAIRKFYRI